MCQMAWFWSPFVPKYPQASSITLSDVPVWLASPRSLVRCLNTIYSLSHPGACENRPSVPVPLSMCEDLDRFLVDLVSDMVKSFYMGIKPGTPGYSSGKHPLLARLCMQAVLFTSPANALVTFGMCPSCHGDAGL